MLMRTQTDIHASTWKQWTMTGASLFMLASIGGCGDISTAGDVQTTVNNTPGFGTDEIDVAQDALHRLAAPANSEIASAESTNTDIVEIAEQQGEYVEIRAVGEGEVTLVLTINGESGEPTEAQVLVTVRPVQGVSLPEVERDSIEFLGEQFSLLHDLTADGENLRGYGVVPFEMVDNVSFASELLQSTGELLSQTDRFITVAPDAEVDQFTLTSRFDDARTFEVTRIESADVTALQWFDYLQNENEGEDNAPYRPKAINSDTYELEGGFFLFGVEAQTAQGRVFGPTFSVATLDPEVCQFASSLEDSEESNYRETLSGVRSRGQFFVVDNREDATQEGTCTIEVTMEQDVSITSDLALTLQAESETE